MNHRYTKNFITEVNDKVLKLQQVSQESGLDLTEDLVKTLNQLSELSQCSDPLSPLDEDYSKIDESIDIFQPDNSLISLKKIDTSLVANIRKKNLELQKDCSKKINELRSATKELCSVNLSIKPSLITEENTAERTSETRNRSKTLPDYPETPLFMIYNELKQIKTELAVANKKISENQDELVKQKNENFELKDQINNLIEANNESYARRVCECLIF